MYTIHATKKLLDRVRQPVEAPVAEPSTLLGSWYATALFWKPQVALLVNERTLVPVLLPLAPAGQLAKRVPDRVGRVLEGLGMPIEFVLQEVAAMSEATYAKTANRSTVGMLNEFGVLADAHRAHGDADDLVALSVRLGRARRAGVCTRATASPTLSWPPWSPSGSGPDAVGLSSADACRIVPISVAL